MKRRLGIILILLMLAGCAAPSGSAPPAEPVGLYPETVDALYAMATLEYFSKEREPYALNESYEGEIVIEGSQLLWKKEEETVCLAQLPKQNWQRVVDRTQVGVVLISDTGAWLVDREGRLRSLVFAPSDEEFSFMICQPYFYAGIGGNLYRGHLQRGELEKICRLDGAKIFGLRVRKSTDILLNIRDAQYNFEMQMYCEANGRLYPLAEVLEDNIWRYDELHYLTQRNRDLKERGTNLAEFCISVESENAPLTFTVTDAPTWENVYGVEEAEYLAVEQYARNLAEMEVNYPTIGLDVQGKSGHDCENGENHLLRLNPLIVPSYTRCLGDLGEGDWQNLGVTTTVGQLLYREDNRTLWLYETAQQRLHPIATLPEGIGEVSCEIYEPMYYIFGERSIYRGSLISGGLTKVWEMPDNVSGQIGGLIAWTNDSVQLIVRGDKTEDYGWIVSNRTGRAYHVQARMNGGWIEADWASYYAQRRADLDRMGVTEEFFKSDERNWSEP